ncbi:MAG: hypothetical protein UX06_C0054G0010 [Candidatus Giovannonibacteria bacterium GW2011_GWA2_45_21]|uniref:MBL fold metallo-hydrolase n=1 Tax=Candidatus Giovannonibacteria bacterium GW2011_GWA2_45_21 TaxID=1618649 RepID=A0A0G1M332_9BACT|nr:MAG: hypothetical protein UX06_C0054G0010 [Candidatus Giovannonibacteria bacterium GW2011_GWA2_45_21]
MVTIHPISHATAILKWGGEIIYTDPVGGASAFEGQRKPTLILITDIHWDHLSAETLAAILPKDASLIAPKAVVDILPGMDMSSNETAFAYISPGILRIFPKCAR